MSSPRELHRFRHAATARSIGLIMLLIASITGERAEARDFFVSSTTELRAAMFGVGQSLDPNEEIEVLEMPYAEFLDYGRFEVQHALHAAALFYAERFFLTRPDLRP